jgi:myosin-crossreactive antigen
LREKLVIDYKRKSKDVRPLTFPLSSPSLSLIVNLVHRQRREHFTTSRVTVAMVAVRVTAQVLKELIASKGAERREEDRVLQIIFPKGSLERREEE